MSELLTRIRKKSLHSKIMQPEDTIPFFKNGMDLAWSGFTPVGYPKVVPLALADYVEQNNLQGKMRFNLFIGASIGAEVEDRWASLGMTDKRWPYQTGKVIQKQVNTGQVRMGDKHLSLYAQDLGYGFYTKNRGGGFDLGLIEASGIAEDGSIILAGSIGSATEAIRYSDKLIIEINTAIPSFEGIHDIVMQVNPPHRKPFLISRVDDRIGTLTVPCDHEKIIAIVESKNPDRGRSLAAPDELSEQIAQYILDFFGHEVRAGRLPKNLLPLQSGVGNIANAVVGGMVKGPFSNVNVWTEVIQDTMLDFFDSGKLNFASSTSLSLSESGFKRFYDNWDAYINKVVLRPMQISNHPEPIRRLGVIAMNTPVEFDIYGHANSTLVGGTRMINGIGGSGDFLRNAQLSIMHTPSTRPSKTDPTGITCVVPFATHVDHTEHDLDILVTEQGLADLRGLCPRERAREIIKQCVHPDFKPILTEYYERSERECFARGVGHEPHMLFKAFKMQEYLENHGTMKIPNWD
ncbi:acetyl-CoA hydrolase/transferase C-terminal domain-containing protein [Chrysiogenes arsenatis]|uniref:acetyl-CoA hydrolase/transferase C-terminal domain-containing protein n=1 Tax=Chrysiogenes arsenatis TaxID=309797 RepID=UPI0004033E4F|nr:acetyl-CoA hydrolase/transferase C-terminal domain-containing protein [Chrysiogenes arsenatis]